MKEKTADFLLARLHENGVRRIYGYPGDGINAIVGALARSKDKIEFVQVRHEEMAAFMACAHAKWTGEVGVCLATSGPGAIHLLNGLYDAKLDHAPVLAIVGQQARVGARRQLPAGGRPAVAVQGRRARVLRDGVRPGADPPPRRPRAPDRARPAPADLPDHPERPRRGAGRAGSAAEARHDPLVARLERASRICRHRRDLQRAAEILNAGEKVAILVGPGARGARRRGDADRREARRRRREGAAGPHRRSTTRCPTVTGSIGLLGTKPSWTLMNDCDTLLMVGSSFPYSEFLPEPGQARGVQIDLDGRMLNIRYPMELGLIGDAKETLEELIPLVAAQDRPSLARRTIEERGRGLVAADRGARAPGRRPDQPAAALLGAQQLPPGRRDPRRGLGHVRRLVRALLKLKPTHLASLSGTLATMGPGVPYAIAAKFAHPSVRPSRSSATARCR